MTDRSNQADWSGRLAQESKRWVGAGLITEAQRSAILQLHPAPVADRRDRTVLIFSILGSLLVGAGVILFFAANWQRLPAAFKVGVILSAILASYGVGYHLQYRRGDYPRLGHSLILLGGLLYGAGIWLVAQIFHLESHFPNGFLLWSAGLLPLAWVTESRPIGYLATFLLMIWTPMEQMEFSSYNFLFPVLLVGAVWTFYRRMEDDLGEAASLLGLFIWIAINVGRDATALRADGPFDGQVALLYGAAVFLVGLARLGEQRVYLSVGGVLVLLGNFLLTFRWGPAVYIPSWLGATAFHKASLAVLLVAVLLAGWRYWRLGEPQRGWLLPAVLLSPALGLGVHLMAAVPRMVTFNLLLFSGALALIVIGVQRRMELVLNLGLLVFLVQVLTRYFDLFFSAMDRSLFFVFGGVLLLGGGWWLERNRRRWVQEWGGGDLDA